MMTYSEKAVSSFTKQVFSRLLIEEKDHELIITLNRPEKKNAIDTVMMNELAFALAYANYNTDIWVVQIAAKGDVFCAGADLKAFAGKEEMDTRSSIPSPKSEVVLVNEFIGLHRPCIAKVHGPVYAGGHLIIGSCTHVVAAEEAFFALPEVKRGLWPFQVMGVLLQNLPLKTVLDWCMRGQKITAQKAKEIGLITEVVSSAELDGAVNKLVAEIKEGAPTAIRNGLKAYDEMRSKPLIEQQAYLKEMLTKTLQSGDAQEGLKAFLEKRNPVWKGK